MNRVMD